MRVWDARTGECQQVFTGHTDMILDLRLVDLQSQELLQNPSAAAGGEGDKPMLVVTASDDQTAKVFRWPQEAETVPVAST